MTLSQTCEHKVGTTGLPDKKAGMLASATAWRRLDMAFSPSDEAGSINRRDKLAVLGDLDEFLLRVADFTVFRSEELRGRLPSASLVVPAARGSLLASEYLRFLQHGSLSYARREGRGGGCSCVGDRLV